MKRLIFAMLSMLLMASAAHALPARRGLWRTISLTNGTQVRAQLVGDEFLHYYQDEEGNTYMADSTGAFAPTDIAPLAAKASARRVARHQTTARRVAQRTRGTQNYYAGTKRCLILLVDFPDKKFESAHDQAFYNRVANERGLKTDEGFVGSVKDYFLAQSNDLFNLEFDVKGPYTMTNSYTYYGKGRNDTYAYKMVEEACTQAHADGVDFSNYDWTGSGDVDLVYIIYAGYGAATGGEENTIWPHQSYIDDKVLDGKTVSTYACSNEIDLINETASAHVQGIGPICHEFSHCLGFPDLYDTSSNDNYGVGYWDLLSDGSYNGDTFCPSGYSAYEKWMAGWLTPIELSDEDVQVDNLKALSEGGDAYIIYNPNTNYSNEYYLLENRQRTNWDSYLPGNGLLVTHVDYDATAWDYNTVNNTTGHLRYALIPADGRLSYYNEEGDAYPYNANDSLTNNSSPKATLHNVNTDGSKLMNKGIVNITRNADSTVSFLFKAVSTTTAGTVEREDETVLHETFDQCSGTGGNDGAWAGNVGSGSFVTDVAGWTCEKAYGGKKCARLGTSKVAADITSPTFLLTGGTTTITLVMAPWGTIDNETVSIYLGDTYLGTGKLTKGAWNQCTITTTATGSYNLRIVASNRLWLDDVLIEEKGTSGISGVKYTPERRADNRIFNLQGQYMGRDASILPSGIYVSNGRKFVK